jgi:hypothetical protein
MQEDSRICLGIDPGQKSSGVVVLDWGNRQVLMADNQYPNERLLNTLKKHNLFRGPGSGDIVLFSCIDMVSIEKVVTYGRSVGQETMDTAWWGGKFHTAAEWAVGRVEAISRPTVKMMLYGSLVYKDATSRKGVDTKLLKSCAKSYFEPTGGGNDPYRGTVKCKGPLFCVRGVHAWDALFVALSAMLA